MVLFLVIQLILTFSLILLFSSVFLIIQELQLHLFFSLVISLYLTYFLALLILALLNKVTRVLMVQKEGVIKGLDLIFWTIQETSLDISLNLTRMFFIHTPVPDVLYKLFGFKKRKGVSILTRLWDPDLLDIGENTLIGPGAIVSAHHIRNGILRRKKVTIGKNVTIGANTILATGITIGDNTMVGYGSSIPPNSHLDANSLYSGVPVKKIKSLTENA